MTKPHKDALDRISISPFGRYVTSKYKTPSTPDTLPTSLALSYFDLNPPLLEELADLLTSPRSKLLADSTLISWVSCAFHRVLEAAKSHLLNIGFRSLKIADISHREDNAEDTVSNGSDTSDTSNQSLQPYKKLTLKAFLDQRHHITKLDLVRVGVSDQHAESFAKLLNNNQITSVDLQWNKISTGAALVLVKAALKHPNISYINLANNKVGDDFVQKILPDLKAVKHRLTIDLHRKPSKQQMPELEDAEHNITVHGGILECNKPSEDITVFKKQRSASDIQQNSEEAMQFVDNMFGVPDGSEPYMDRSPVGCVVSGLTGVLNAWEEVGVMA